jgi:hypothetical protein
MCYAWEKVLVGELRIRAVVEGSDDQRSEDYCEEQAENDSVRDEFLRQAKTTASHGRGFGGAERQSLESFAG